MTPAEQMEVDLVGGGKLRRDLEHPSSGYVECPDCKVERHVGKVPSAGSKQLQGYTGRHRACENRRMWTERIASGVTRRARSAYPTKFTYPTEDLPLGEYGSIALWSTYRRGRFVVIKCGECGKPHRTVASEAIEPKSGFTGLHKECFQQILSRTKSFTHEVRFPTGTKALWQVRHPDDRHKIGIECSGCYNESRQIKYVWDTQIQNHIKWLIMWYANLRWLKADDATIWQRLWPYLKRAQQWSTHCHDCTVRGEIQKLVGKQTAPSGTVTDFDDEVDGKVLVFYANPEWGCECKPRVKRDSAVTHWREYATVCRYHRNHPEEYQKILQERAGRVSNGNGQKNGSAAYQGNPAKRRGRKPGTTGFDHKNFPAEVNAFILELWKQRRSVVDITREAVAAKFQAKGEALRGSHIKDRLKICGITDSWPVYRQSVINEAG